MKYSYQTEDMDALRLTFERMIEEIDQLNEALDNGDEAIMELYNEANDLEQKLNHLRGEYDQAMFDATEDYVELERDVAYWKEAYDNVVADYNTLWEALHNDSYDPLQFDGDDEKWELFHATGISLN